MNFGLSLIGDALSIAALSVIASVSLSVWKRVLPGARVPIQFRRDGQPGMRLKRTAAVLFMPIVATVLLFAPMATQAAKSAPGTDEALMFFVLRTLLAVGMAVAHIVHMRHALIVLDAEGQLRS